MTITPRSGRDEDSRERRRHFGSRYGADASEASVLLGVLAMGEDVGVNGYTTIAEADRLASLLDLSHRSLVLDLGSGRGWPGTYLSQRCGCRVVLTDLPIEPLRQARRYAESRNVSERVSAVCSDSHALPFGSGVFDAVTHADVLC